jgi:hypothetical protein
VTDQHSITPPPELVQQWSTEGRHQDYCTLTESVAARAAQWGADRELEAVLHLCDEWLTAETIRRIRASRRPKPPSLKEEALEALEQIDGYAIDQLSAYTIHKELKQYANTIRRAIEALPDD